MAADSNATIRAIDSHSVHRITSGQVVIDLQTAVKELVENSLDAHATNIEVRFKDYGLKTIEVIDNGSGIAPGDYDSIALKHHTSKLSSFEDLSTVMTFGFRGEALSSLCALSESVTLTTATATAAPMGTVLEMDRNGRVKSRSGKAARQRGTTLTVSGLFKPLPVRRKELERNAKREFGKALNLLSAYALVPCAKENKGVRLTVSNHPEGGRKTIQLRTDGTASTRNSVSALWGPKSLENIIDLDLSFNVDTERSVLKRRGNTEDSGTQVRVRGLISKFSVGCGRTGTDRQFFFINGRPCNPSKAQKAFNEVYRSFNANQSPFIVADFLLPTNTCDINVSPDKRTIFLHSENNLVEALKTTLEEAFSTSRSTFDVNATQNLHKQASIFQKPKLAKPKEPTSKEPLNQNETETGEKGDHQNEYEEGAREEAEQDRGMGEPHLLLRDDLAQDSDIGSTRHEIDLSIFTAAVTDELIPSGPGPTLERVRQSDGNTSVATMVSPDAVNKRKQQSSSDSNNDSASGSDTIAIPVDPRIDYSSGNTSHDVDLLNTAFAEEEPPFGSLEDALAMEEDMHASQLRESGSPTASQTLLPKSRLSDASRTDTVFTDDGTNSIRNNAFATSASRSSSRTCADPRRHDPSRGSVDVESRASEPVQMVLSTSGASWSLLRSAGSDSEPPKKKVRLGINNESLKTPSTRIKDGRAATENLRMRIQAFASTGSQAVTVDPDEEREETPIEDDEEDIEQNVSAQAPVRDDSGQNDAEAPDEGPPGTKSSTPLFLDEIDDDQEIVMGPGADGIKAEHLEPTIDLTVDPDTEVSQLTTGRGDSDINSDTRISGESSVLSEIVRTVDAEEATLRLDFSRISAVWSDFKNKLARLSHANAKSSCVDKPSLGVDAGISNVDDGAKAADVLSRVIDKDDFATMEIAGQFNLGFIITRRRKRVDGDDPEAPWMDDLFIVDQHAADEKYNFETLQQTTKLESQRLFRPQPLELTTADELLAIENLEVLRQNGFDISVNEDALPGQGQRLKLVASPVSKSTVFDMKDMEELLHLMRDRPTGQMVRCSKTRAMFAMRACRKSVMIGTPLTKGQMTTVIRHMGTMDQPWNCPHGRPTMRHLSDIADVDRRRQLSSKAIDWAAFASV